MSEYTFDPNSQEVVKSRLYNKKLPVITNTLLIFGIGTIATGGFIDITDVSRFGAALMGLGCMAIVLHVWLKGDVASPNQARIGSTSQLEKLLPQAMLSGLTPDMSPIQVWTSLEQIWQSRFVVSRFGLHPDIMNNILQQSGISLDDVWPLAEKLSIESNRTTISPAAIVVALVTLEPIFGPVLAGLKLKPEQLKDDVAWVSRLEDFQSKPKAAYGGVARDWAVGYAPMLSQYGENFSRHIELGGNRFGIHDRKAEIDALISGLSSGTGSVAVIGENGIGKTALLYSLAERLLTDRTLGQLSHTQVIALSASAILSNQRGAGDIERTIISLMNEAVHAGNIIIALDEAQLFLGHGVGAVNLSQVLLPVLQSRAVKLIMAVTPGDWQQLRSTNTALAGLITPLVLTEPNQQQTINLLADRALVLEQGKYTTGYHALIEAYRLSDRYMSDEAQPGAALRLLESSYAHASGSYIDEVCVQRAIESQIGVKVEQAGAQENTLLLGLEERIHERMINQTHAVSVVAAALRRARAGVSNPRRPIGSFLFLGPTGVGKTELARSLAAVYYGAESNMIRLDMSEYQQPSDISRIIAGASENPNGLLSRVRQQPFSVVLFDEIEKADPGVLNLMLQLLDEGQLTDTLGHSVSFKDTIIITTSNAGADEIRERIQNGQELEEFATDFTNSLISQGRFKPELLNRYDEIVLFRPLKLIELAQVVGLLIAEVNKTLEPQNIRVELDDDAITSLVERGYDPRLGARPMRRMVTRTVEDAVASRILGGQAKAGDTITLGLFDVGGTAQPANSPSPANNDMQAIQHHNATSASVFRGTDARQVMGGQLYSRREGESSNKAEN